MPDLDVSFVTEDPMLADIFDVKRRADVLVKGRTTPTITETFRGVLGVVTQEGAADLIRRSDGQQVPRRIFIATTFPVQGALTGLQPDIVSWAGTDYVVTQVLPYSRFGGGTYEVVAESMDAMNLPIDNS